MKSRKIKLLASLTSLVLVVAVMAVGVWAAGSVTVNVNGTVSFDAQEKVFATVTIDKATSTATFGDEDQTTPKSINLTTLTVDEVTGTYTYTITVKNDRDGELANADKADLKVDVEVPDAGASYTLEVDKATATLEPGQSTTFVVTFQITNFEVTVQDADVGADITLTNV